MASIPKKIKPLLFLSSLLVFIFFFGQLARVNTGLFEKSIPILDLGIVILSFINLFSFKAKNKINFPLLFFLFYMITRSVFANPSLLSSAYLLRFGSLILLLALPSKNLNKNRTPIRRLFLLVITANAIFGLIQYFLWPDFTFFSSQNWDPHLHRLVSTFFDPTFTALIYIFGLQITHQQQNLNKTIKWGLYLLLFVSLTLTYSRAGMAVFVFLVYLNNKKFTHLAVLVSLITILILPRPPGEGTKLERTSTIRARIVNYQQAISLSQKNPIFGIGYNNLPRIKSQLGLSQPQSHSASAFDSSLLTILSTTGFIGLFLFLLGIKKHLKDTNPINRNLVFLVLLHSLSANSLLYPWILLIIALV